VISRKIVLKFPRPLVDQPIICNLVKQYNLDFNILKAHVTPNEEGLLVLELKGENKSFKEGMHFLEKTGVLIQPLSKDVNRNEIRCTHCGACVAVCSTGALAIDRRTMMVTFENEKCIACIACELCIKACPPRAMVVNF
jgi:Dissimilatory sulfite reductase (desulfoviridin), alpha and beta subunits